MPTPITSEQLVLYYILLYYILLYNFISLIWLTGPCRGRLDLFSSTKVNNMLKKYSINNNDIVPLLFIDIVPWPGGPAIYQYLFNISQQNAPCGHST